MARDPRCCSPAGSTAPCCWRWSGATHEPVWPIHVRAGLAWEDAEARAIERLLARRRRSPGASQPLTTLTVDMRDVYPPTHWAVTGQPPAYDTPDEDVYLEGRNIVLIVEGGGAVRARSSVERARARSAGRQSVSGRDAGVLRDDGARDVARTRAVRSTSSRRSSTCTRRTSSRLGVELRRAARAVDVVHEPAGRPALRRCSKCRERRDAFRVAGLADPTEYAEQWPG